MPMKLKKKIGKNKQIQKEVLASKESKRKFDNIIKKINKRILKISVGKSK